MSFIVTSYENLASVLRVHFLLSCHMLVFPSAETQGECGRSCLAFLLSAVPAWMDVVGTPVPHWAGQGLCLHAILSLQRSSCRSDHQRSASEERGLCAELPALGGCQLQDCWVLSMETRQAPMFTSLVSADTTGRGPYMSCLFKQVFVSVYLVLLQFTTTELDGRACYFLG